MSPLMCWLFGAAGSLRLMFCSRSRRFPNPSRRQTVLYAEGTKVRERENSQHGLIDEWRRTSAGRPALSSWQHDHNDLYRLEKRDTAFSLRHEKQDRDFPVKE